MSTKMIKTENKFSKYETARILGARALQIAMNAPLLIKLSKEELERVNYDPLKIAELEFDSGVLPISIKKPFPKRKEEKLKRTIEKKIDDDSELRKSEEEIAKEGEIMELVNPQEEAEEDVGEEVGEEG